MSGSWLLAVKWRLFPHHGSIVRELIHCAIGLWILFQFFLGLMQLYLGSLSYSLHKYVTFSSFSTKMCLLYKNIWFRHFVTRNSSSKGDNRKLLLNTNIHIVCHGLGFCYSSNIKECLVLLKLANTVLILINTGPSNVKECMVPVQCMLGYDTTARLKFDFESHAQGQCWYTSSHIHGVPLGSIEKRTTICCCCLSTAVTQTASRLAGPVQLIRKKFIKIKSNFQMV